MNAAFPPPGPATGPAALRLGVRGMMCASCVGHVQAALSAVPGVARAEVNLALERADLWPAAGAPEGGDASDAATRRDLLARAAIAAVAREGYEATVLAEAAPLLPDADAQARERAALGRASALSGLLTLPVFVLEMGGHLVPSFHHAVQAALGADLPRWISLVLTGAVLAGPGRRFFVSGAAALRRGRPDMSSLVALGAGAAFVYSLMAMFAPGWLPPGSAHVYFETAAVIVTLVLAGRWIEALSRGRTGSAIRALVALQPATAWREGPAGPVEVPLAEVRPGDRLVVRPGAAIPVDGTVLGGTSHVDEALLTGEPMPVLKGPGARLVAGALNREGSLVMQAEWVGEQTLLAGIIRLVGEAQAARMPIQALVDRVTARFVPAVLAVAALTFAAWLVLAPAPALPFALTAAISVLVIACPCAMGLATPVSIVVASGRAARLGVLFRKGDALERLGRSRLVVFDKTGTLTEGRPALAGIVPVPGGPEAERLLRLAAAAERHSEHPIARALVEAAQARGLGPAAAPMAFRAVPGEGVAARIGWPGEAPCEVRVGALRFLAAEGVALTDTALAVLGPEADRRAARGETVVFVAIDGALSGLFAVADRIRPGAAEMLAGLRQRGLTLALASGDHPRTVAAVAEALGFRPGEDVIEGQVAPEGKAALVKRLRATHGPVAFVGDGINDAPALAAADTGVAMARGADVAIQSADVVLVASDVAAFTRAFDLSRATMANIRQNLVWAFGYNAALIPVAAGLLQPVWGLMLSPMLAAGAMALSSLFVLGNALRLQFAGTAPAGGQGAR